MTQILINYNNTAQVYHKRFKLEFQYDSVLGKPTPEDCVLLMQKPKFFRLLDIFF